MRRGLWWAGRTHPHDRTLYTIANQEAPTMTTKRHLSSPAAAQRVLAMVLNDGFDESCLGDGGELTIKCSQCNALVINNLPSHEQGCPNRSRRDHAAED